MAQVDLADIFGSVVGQLQNDRSRINALDQNGNHGDNMLQNFQLIQQVLNSSRGQGADAQLRQAANALQQNGRGATANMYSQGLLQAAQNLQGRQSIGLDDIIPLLTGLTGGVQRSTQAQQGQGTLLDTLLPAVSNYVSARNSGLSNGEAIQDALGAALRGSQQTYTQPTRYGRARQTSGQPWQDPGASSANSLIQGVFKSLTGLG